MSGFLSDSKQISLVGGFGGIEHAWGLRAGPSRVDCLGVDGQHCSSQPGWLPAISRGCSTLFIPQAPANTAEDRAVFKRITWSGWCKVLFPRVVAVPLTAQEPSATSCAEQTAEEDFEHGCLSCLGERICNLEVALVLCFQHSLWVLETGVMDAFSSLSVAQQLRCRMPQPWGTGTWAVGLPQR